MLFESVSLVGPPKTVRVALQRYSTRCSADPEAGSDSLRQAIVGSSMRTKDASTVTVRFAK